MFMFTFFYGTGAPLVSWLVHRRNIEETGHQSDSSMLTWQPYWVGDVSWLLCKQDDGVGVILRQ